MERGNLHGEEIKNGGVRNPLTLCSVLVMYVQVWVHIPGDPQRVSSRALRKEREHLR